MGGTAGSSSGMGSRSCVSGQGSLGHALFAYVWGALATAFIVLAVAFAAHALLGLPLPTSMTPAYIVWPFVSAGLWWRGMYGDIRGWWIYTSGD